MQSSNMKNSVTVDPLQKNAVKIVNFYGAEPHFSFIENCNAISAVGTNRPIALQIVSDHLGPP